MSDHTDESRASVELVHPDSRQSIEVNPDHVGNYLDQGWRQPAQGAPAGNAKLEDWQAYPTSQGFTADDLAGKTRDELRAALI